jgi:hypothetical protein
MAAGRDKIVEACKLVFRKDKSWYTEKTSTIGGDEKSASAPAAYRMPFASSSSGPPDTTENSIHNPLTRASFDGQVW